MRPPAARRARLAALVALPLLVAGSACSDDKKASAPKAGERPLTQARVQIVSPTPNEVTGPDVSVKVNLIGAREVPQVTGPLKPDEGHIHIALDNNVVAMAYGESHTLKGLTPGKYSIQVDFVAVDHVPFRNRVTAAVLFTVK